MLCGLSMGGQIVLEFHRLFAGRVAGLVLADTFAQAESEQGVKERYARAEALERDGMAGYAHEVLDSMVAPATVEALPEVAGHVLAMMLARAAAGGRRGAARPGRTPRLHRDAGARSPCRRWSSSGSEDVFTPVADARFLHERIAGARLAVVEGAGHMPNLERPEEFNSAVAGLLADVPPTA